MEENNFLGNGWSFPPSFGQGGVTAEMIGGEADIQQSLIILLSANKQERLMHPNFGCDLSRFIYEEITPNVITNIKELINDAILHYEPRIILNAVNVAQDNEQPELLIITLDYQIKVNNARSNLVYPFYLNEATNIIA